MSTGLGGGESALSPTSTHLGQSLEMHGRESSNATQSEIELLSLWVDFTPEEMAYIQQPLLEADAESADSGSACIDTQKLVKTQRKKRVVVGRRRQGKLKIFLNLPTELLYEASDPKKKINLDIKGNFTELPE